MKIVIILKNIVALLASGYACMMVLAIGLVGTGDKSILESIIKIFTIGAGAGIVIGILPVSPTRMILFSAVLPSVILAFLLIAGFMEQGGVENLIWLGMPAGISLLVIAPSFIRNTFVSRE